MHFKNSIIRTWMTSFAVTASLLAYSQVPADPLKAKEYRSQLIKTVIERVSKKHFSPRPLDNTYSAAVWKTFIYALDPGSNIFLQTDIAKLADQKTSIDDQFASGSTAFFDSAYAIYSVRIKEAHALCNRILDEPFDFSSKDSVVIWRKEFPFPAGPEEREALWRKLLKYHVLKNYMELRAAAGDTLHEKLDVDKVTLAKSCEKVRIWYNSQFRASDKPSFPDEKFSQYIAVAMLEIDPHTYYSGPADKTLEQQLTKRYYGLGMELSVRDADFYIKKLVPGGAAWKSGQVKENDNVISVSDSSGKMIPVTGLTAVEVTSMIRGDKGTEVALLLQTPGEMSRTVKLKRDEVIDMENRAKGAVIDRNGEPYGYIQLPLFYMDPAGLTNGSGAAADLAREVEKLKQAGVKGIVVDLRGNGGGSLDEVVRMTRTFLPGGPVTWLRTRANVNEYSIPDATPAYDGPLAVLVDEGSASASEIFAAVMQDRGRAIIIGSSSTFGKGTAQAPQNLGILGDSSKGIPDLSFGSLRLTIQRFYRVTGTSTQLKGVKPDIVLQDRMRQNELREADFSSSLPCDTIHVLPFNMVGPAFNYSLVVANAQRRIHNNPAFAAVSGYMNDIQALAIRPIPLDLVSFRQYSQCSALLEKDLREAKTLNNAGMMNVTLAVDQNIRPDLRQEDQASRNNQEWLRQVSGDIYIAESISVLEDMAAHPAPSHAQDENKKS